MTSSQLVRVTHVRSQNPSGFGGCIFTAKAISVAGEVEDASAYLVVKANAKVLGGTEVQVGQWWRVAGPSLQRRQSVNGYTLTEWQVDAEAAALERPSGEHLVRFMADNPAFESIGEVKARKLWDAFGERLYGLLDAGDTTALSSVLSPDVAAKAVVAWAEQADTQTLQWLQAEGIDLALGRKVLRFFGRDTKARLEEDPYRLLSFCGSWRDVDRLAKKHFGVQPDDPRRLQGAVEEACYRLFAEGHTSALSSTLMDRLAAVLGPQTSTLRWRGLVSNALSQGLSNGSYVVGHHGVQPLGALAMERQVADAVASRLVAPNQALMAAPAVERLLTDYETLEGLELNPEQRQAVQVAARSAMTLITGGAGVGKTTVLKAIYRMYEAAGCEVVQLALAGRAAKRMQEATGRPASTIANFLRSGSALPERCVVVVDEASMVDIITMSRLCLRLGPLPRLLLVGDPGQLMPVGPGLVLHALCAVPAVPHVELKTIKRYGGAIAEAAQAIRAGRWPALPSDEAAPIAFIPCEAADIPELVLRLRQQDSANTQVLSARRGGPEGTRGLNTLCQSVLTATAAPLLAWDEQLDCVVRTGFHLGDPVLCTRNLWDRGLQNGSLGVVVEVSGQAEVRPTQDEAAPILGWIEWDDGEKRPVTEAMLDDLELAYAITVHKAQGSQWQRVIVPLTGRRLLDRTLIYTAVTRAQLQAILIGDASAIVAAVAALPRSANRAVSLDLWVERILRRHTAG